MTENRDMRPKEAAVMPISDVAHAPFIFYESAPAFGAVNAVIGVTSAAHRTLVRPDGTIANDQVVAAYLQGSVQAARSLRDALNGALLLAAPAGEGKSN